MERKVQPEILDSLPEDHPEALHNRRDLQLINTLMGNFRWFERVLPPLLRADETGLELGPGDGLLGARLSRDSRLPKNIRLDGLDRWRRPERWPPDWRWHREDLLRFSGYEDFDFFVANLILHQFERKDLVRLGDAMRRRGRLIVACEPVRRRRHLFQTWLLKPFGINRVSWHDCRVSIGAGFRNHELPELLGLAPDQWDIRVHATVMGAYRMIAVRL